MSHHSLNPVSQSQSFSSHSPNIPELAERIERFQKAAQDLLEIYEPPKLCSENDSQPAPTVNGETRCFYLSQGAVQHRR